MSRLALVIAIVLYIVIITKKNTAIEAGRVFVSGKEYICERKSQPKEVRE